MDKRTNNQDIVIIIEIKSVIENLINKEITQVAGIDKIKAIIFPNLHLAEKIAAQIINKYYEVNNSGKQLILLYLIDSLIKNFEGSFIPVFSKQIVNLFSEAYSVSDNETKINLFKLYYSWKYFFEPKVLTALRDKYDLDEIKRQIQITNPEIIERYDKFNKEQEMKRMNVNKQDKRIVGMIAEDDKLLDNYNKGRNINVVSKGVSINNNIMSINPNMNVNPIKMPVFTNNNNNNNITNNNNNIIYNNNNNFNNISSNQVRNSAQNSPLTPNQSHHESSSKLSTLSDELFSSDSSIIDSPAFSDTDEEDTKKESKNEQTSINSNNIKSNNLNTKEDNSNSSKSKRPQLNKITPIVRPLQSNKKPALNVQNNKTIQSTTFII